MNIKKIAKEISEEYAGAVVTTTVIREIMKITLQELAEEDEKTVKATLKKYKYQQGVVCMLEILAWLMAIGSSKQQDDDEEEWDDGF